MLKKKPAVTRPGEYVNKAILRPRWSLSVQGSWICPLVLNPRQVDNDDCDDDDSDHWPHLDSLMRENKPPLSQKDNINKEAGLLFAVLSLRTILIYCFLHLVNISLKTLKLALLVSKRSESHWCKINPQAIAHSYLKKLSVAVVNFVFSQFNG